MLSNYRETVNTELAMGIALMLMFAPAFYLIGGPSSMAVIVALAGYALQVHGCVMLAKAKGHSAAWGFLGVFFLAGLLVLVLMPDACKGTSHHA